MNKQKNTGFMMVEVIVAVAIISVSILTAMSISQKSIQLSYRSLHTTQATFLLEEGAEAVRIIRDNAWTNISNKIVDTKYFLAFPVNTWVLDTNATEVGKFNRSVKFFNVYRNTTSGDIVPEGSSGASIDTGTKLVTVTIIWAEGGQEFTKELSFYLMDVFS